MEAAENEIGAAGSKLRVAVETLCGKISGRKLEPEDQTGRKVFRKCASAVAECCKAWQRKQAFLH